VNNFFANPSAIQYPAPFTLGNAPRTTADIRTPLSFTSDLSIAKQFLLSNVHEGIRLEVRLEAQNAFNHPVFGTPNTNAGDPSLGTITYLAVGPRQGQLAVKISSKCEGGTVSPDLLEGCSGLGTNLVARPEQSGNLTRASKLRSAGQFYHVLSARNREGSRSPCHFHLGDALAVNDDLHRPGIEFADRELEITLAL
jgi:hypothetical protein